MHAWSMNTSPEECPLYVWGTLAQKSKTCSHKDLICDGNIKARYV